MQQKSVLFLYMLTISDIFSHQQNADYHSYQSDSYGHVMQDILGYAANGPTSGLTMGIRRACR